MCQMGHDIIEPPKIEHLSTGWASPKVLPFRGRQFFVFVRCHCHLDSLRKTQSAPSVFERN
jgi:hypothetical protein